MMARRRDRAHTKLNTGAKNIAAKYEGQRTDGSHAVNGTAYVQNKTAAFQFYFDKKGIKIDRFVVNKTQGSGNAGSNASSSSSMPSGDQQACLAVVSNKANNGDVTVPATED